MILATLTRIRSLKRRLNLRNSSLLWLPFVDASDANGQFKAAIRPGPLPT